MEENYPPEYFDKKAFDSSGVNRKLYVSCPGIEVNNDVKENTLLQASGTLSGDFSVDLIPTQEGYEDQPGKRFTGRWNADQSADGMDWNQPDGDITGIHYTVKVDKKAEPAPTPEPTTKHYSITGSTDGNADILVGEDTEHAKIYDLTGNTVAFTGSMDLKGLKQQISSNISKYGIRDLSKVQLRDTKQSAVVTLTLPEGMSYSEGTKAELSGLGDAFQVTETKAEGKNMKVTIAPKNEFKTLEELKKAWDAAADTAKVTLTEVRVDENAKDGALFTVTGSAEGSYAARALDTATGNTADINVTWKAKQTEEGSDFTDADHNKLQFTLKYHKVHKAPYILLLKTIDKGTTLHLSWTKVAPADGYIVYGARCNHDGKIVKMKKIKKLPASKQTLVIRGAKKGVSYKYIVKAYQKNDGDADVIAKSNDTQTLVLKSNTTHTSVGMSQGPNTKGTTNAVKVTVSKKKASLKTGKKYQIKAKVKAANGKLFYKEHASKLRYISGDKYIAKVSKSGKVTGAHKGSCKIYVLAPNGVRTSIKVTVR